VTAEPPRTAKVCAAPRDGAVWADTADEAAKTIAAIAQHRKKYF